jgi:hypothetical protein
MAPTSAPLQTRLAKGMKTRVIPDTEVGGGNFLNRCPVKGDHLPGDIQIPEKDIATITAGPVVDEEHGLRFWRVTCGTRQAGPRSATRTSTGWSP